MPDRLPPLSIAPMMDRTNRHYRFFMRQITRHTLLYTEMVTSHAILHGDLEYLLGFEDVEHPIALQLGGDNPADLARCAQIAVDYGYDEVNLNVGCPSSRVQRGSFGACLMKTPETVARAAEAMMAAVDIPVTVKHRIGVDDLDRYEDMANFVRVVSGTGVQRFSVHARKAWLQGLSPKQNRTVPPLRYDDVYRLKEAFPHLDIEINGGIVTLDQAEAHLERVDAVMIGRAAWDDPWLFSDADRRFFGENGPTTSRDDVVMAMLPYLARWSAGEHKLHRVTRHMQNLYRGQRGARRWKQILSEESTRPDAGPEVVEKALAAMA